MRNEVCTDCQNGSASAELVVLTPLVIIFALVLLIAGKLLKTESIVHDAARAGAQTAALQGYPQAAELGAREVIGYEFKNYPNLCTGGEQVVVNTTHFYPGGYVTVSVSCSVSSFGAIVPGLPLYKTISFSASFPISPYTEITG